MLHSIPLYMKCGKRHFMSSSTSGHDACTASRSLVRIGFAKSPALAMYASTRGSLFPITLLSLLEQFRFVRSVRLQADRDGPAKAGHYVHVETALVSRVPVRYPVVVDPVAPDDEQPERFGRPGHGGGGRRRRPERAGGVDDHQERDQRPEADRAD